MANNYVMFTLYDAFLLYSVKPCRRAEIILRFFHYKTFSLEEMLAYLRKD